MYPVVAAVLQFVDQDGQHDGHRELPEQSGQVDLKRVPDRADRRRRGKNAREIGPSDPLGSPDSEPGVEFFESQHQAAHRHVVENDEIGKYGDQQDIEIPCLPDPRKYLFSDFLMVDLFKRHYNIIRNRQMKIGASFFWI